MKVHIPKTIKKKIGKNVFVFHWKIIPIVICDLAILLLGIYPKELKINTHTKVSISGLFLVSKEETQPTSPKVE